MPLVVSRTWIRPSSFTPEERTKFLFRKDGKSHLETFPFLEIEGVRLELLEKLDKKNDPLVPGNPEEPQSLYPHLAIASDDLTATIHRLNDDHVPILKDPMEIPSMVRLFHCLRPGWQRA